MGLDDIKLYCLNITSFTIASFDWLEPTLGYTVHKWLMMKKNKKK